VTRTGTEISSDVRRKSNVRSNSKSDEYVTFFVTSYFLPISNALLVTLLKFVLVTSNAFTSLKDIVPSCSCELQLKYKL